MKKLIFSALALISSLAFGSQNLNHIGCIYFHNNSVWHLWQSFFTAKSFTLKEGEAKVLTGAWTSDKPTLPNFAFCTSMVGTSSDEKVTIETYRYSATAFDPIAAGSMCVAQGIDVNLLSKESVSVQRGSHAELEIDWISPEADKLIVKEYFPLVEELNDIEEIAKNKCIELQPK